MRERPIFRTGFGPREARRATAEEEVEEEEEEEEVEKEEMEEEEAGGGRRAPSMWEISSSRMIRCSTWNSSSSRADGS